MAHHAQNRTFRLRPELMCAQYVPAGEAHPAVLYSILFYSIVFLHNVNLREVPLLGDF